MKRFFLLMVFLAVSVQSDAAKMSSYTENTTPNDDVYFIGVDPNDTTQTANGSNYRYPLSSILGSGLFDLDVNSLTVSGTGDSWIELENNTSFTDTLTGKYGLRFYNGALQQIINGTASAIGGGSLSVTESATLPDPSTLSDGDLVVATDSGDMLVKTATGSYVFAGTYTATPTLPTFVSAEQTDGTTFVLTLSEAITIGSGGSGGVVVTGSTTGASATTYASGDTTASITYTTTETFVTGETITVAYTQPGDGLEDAGGDDLASFTAQSVTNSIIEAGCAGGSDGTIGYATQSGTSYDGAANVLFYSRFTPTTDGTIGNAHGYITNGTARIGIWSNSGTLLAGTGSLSGSGSPVGAIHGTVDEYCLETGVTYIVGLWRNNAFESIGISAYSGGSTVYAQTLSTFGDFTPADTSKEADRLITVTLNNSADTF